MSKYLHTLVAECDPISEESLAGQLTKLSKPEESETILGRASPGLLRLSVGLEDVEDLWEDLEPALDKAAR